MKRILLTCLTIFIGITAMEAQTANQFNAWYMYFGNHKLNDKWGLHTEYQFRRSGLIKDWQQSLARVGLDYKVNNSTMLTGGYGWIVSFPYGEQPSAAITQEHRIWQQLILKQKSGVLSFQHRYRLEQRFLENVIFDKLGEPVSDGYRFRQRARYRMLVSVPLTKKEDGTKQLFAAVYDEVFLGFGEGIGPNILDQNRLYAGLGLQIDNSSNVQVGYLYHRVFKADGLSRENNSTFNVAYTKNLDFSSRD